MSPEKHLNLLHCVACAIAPQTLLLINATYILTHEIRILSNYLSIAATVGLLALFLNGCYDIRCLIWAYVDS